MPQVIHWFRRDFRVRDNAGLLRAAELAGRDGAVIGTVVIDPRWWQADRQKLGAFQAAFWLRSIEELAKNLKSLGIPLVIRTHADPVAALLTLARETGATAITFNKEYEPAQIEMDDRLQREAKDIRIHAIKDACHFEETDILTGAHQPYSVFTPYKNAYLRKLAEDPPVIRGAPRKQPLLPTLAGENLPTPRSLGFAEVQLDIHPGERAARSALDDFCEHTLATYAETRDPIALSLPDAPHHTTGTSRLSAHLNAGTLSIRQAIAAVLEARTRFRKPAAKSSADVFLSELIWREFYRMILFHHPHTVSQPFNARYEGITWTNSPAHIEAFEQGRTGYPIIDAAIAQLLTTGFMHNRLRMMTAMFLTKDLDVHWTIGERFFMRTLIDYDQASNVGGWQWSASTGTDAAPYFRIMNPVLQSEKFDPEGKFIKHYVPALRNVPTKFIHVPWEMPADLQTKCNCHIGEDYPNPIVDHPEAKAAAIAKFKQQK